MEVEINLFSDVADGVRRMMSDAGYDVASIEHDDHKALVAYSKWNRYVVAPRPRRVFKARGFETLGHTSGLMMLENAIVDGEDLSIYMTKTVANVVAKDPLLDHWGIHHFHLGTELDARYGTMRRTNHLLFCRIDDDNAYFIKVASHGSWYQQEMLEILHQNWPWSIEFARAKEVTDVEHQFSDDEIRRLRDAHVTTLLKVADGAVYVEPGMGTTGDGTSVVDQMYADRVRRTARHIESQITDNFAGIKDNARLQGRHFSATASFTLLEAQVGSHWDILETGTRYRFRVWE